MPSRYTPKVLRKVEPAEKRIAIHRAGQYDSHPFETKQFVDLTRDMRIYSGPLKTIAPDSANRARTQSPGGHTYRAFIHSVAGTVYTEESPEKALPLTESREVRFIGQPSLAELRQNNPELFLNPKTESFEFTVTKEMIEKRIGQKRPQSQNEVVGYSAQEGLIALGAIIDESIKGQFHHAHRHAWMFLGEQIKKNMDEATAESNYATLYTIEEPIKTLLTGDTPITSMHVKGKVIFHPNISVAIEVIYHLSWGNGREAQISTYPIERRSPTVVENKMAHAVLNTIVTPEKSESVTETTPGFFKKAEASTIHDTARKLDLSPE